MAESPPDWRCAGARRRVVQGRKPHRLFPRLGLVSRQHRRHGFPQAGGQQGRNTGRRPLGAGTGPDILRLYIRITLRGRAPLGGCGGRRPACIACCPNHCPARDWMTITAEAGLLPASITCFLRVRLRYGKPLGHSREPRLAARTRPASRSDLFYRASIPALAPSDDGKRIFFAGGQERGSWCATTPGEVSLSPIFPALPAGGSIIRPIGVG